MPPTVTGRRVRSTTPKRIHKTGKKTVVHAPGNHPTPDVFLATRGKTSAPSAAETALIKLLGAAAHRVYVNLSAKTSPALVSAMVSAAQHGLDVRALLNTSAGHDKTWMLQQHLESSGIDVDVHKTDPLPGTYALVDDKGLSISGTTTKPITSGLEDLIKRFKAQFAVAPAPKPNATLLAPGKVALHKMPESMSTRIVEVIAAAQKTIDLEIYQLQDRNIIEALKAAAGRSPPVRVRVMLEPKTVGAKNFDAVAAELRAAGVSVKETPPNFDGHHNVDHAKFLVVDGKEMLYGTGNLVRSGLGGDTEAEYNNRDFWLEDARPKSVAEAQQLFNADWLRQPTTGINFENLLITPDNADAGILALIDRAKKRLYVYNQELEDPEIIAKLIAAKKKNPPVDVRVLVGYQPGFGGPPKNDAALKQLAAAGIPATYLKSHYLHAKAIVSDDEVYLGSQNFTNGGLRANRELGQVFGDPDLVAQVVETFIADAANPG